MHSRNIRRKTVESSFLKTLSIYSILTYIIISVVYDGTGFSNLSLSTYAIYLCAGICGLNALLSGNIRVLPTYILMLAFGAALQLSSYYTPTSQFISNMYLYRFWTALVLFVLAANTITSREDVDKLLKGYVLSGPFLSIVVYSNFGIANLVSTEDRVLETIGDINMLGAYCAFSIIVSLVYIFTSKKHKLLYLLAIVICVPFLMFTGSRKAVLIVVIGLVTFVLTYTRKKGLFKRLLIISLLLGGIVLLIYKIPAFSIIKEHFEDMLNLFTGQGDLDKGDENRIKYLELGWKHFLDKPLFGNGFCSSYYYFRTYTHCNYIELLMNNGIVGFVLYYAVHFTIITTAFRYRKKADVLTSLVFTFMLCLLFCDIGVVTYYNRFMNIILAICAKAVIILKDESLSMGGGNNAS